MNKRQNMILTHIKVLVTVFCFFILYGCSPEGEKVTMLWEGLIYLDLSYDNKIYYLDRGYFIVKVENNSDKIVSVPIYERYSSSSLFYLISSDVINNEKLIDGEQLTFVGTFNEKGLKSLGGNIHLQPNQHAYLKFIDIGNHISQMPGSEKYKRRIEAIWKNGRIIYVSNSELQDRLIKRDTGFYFKTCNIPPGDKYQGPNSCEWNEDIEKDSLYQPAIP